MIPARPKDVWTILGVIKAYSEVVSGPAGQPPQWGRDRILYIPKIRFLDVAKGRHGNVAAHSMTHPEFVEASDAAMENKAIDEHEIHQILHPLWDIAHVLSKVDQKSSFDGPAIGHSIDNPELFYDGRCWWIVHANIWNTASSDQALQNEFMP